MNIKLLAKIIVSQVAALLLNVFIGTLFVLTMSYIFWFMEDIVTWLLGGVAFLIFAMNVSAAYHTRNYTRYDDDTN